MHILSAFDGSAGPGRDDHVGAIDRMPLIADLPYRGMFERILRYYQTRSSTTDMEDWRYGVFQYQLDWLTTGRLRSFELHTGQPIVATHGFPVYTDTMIVPFLYRFEKPTLHYHLLGFQPTQLIGTFFPRDNTLISFMNPAHPIIQGAWESDRLGKVCRSFQALLGQFDQAVERYLSATPAPRVAACWHPNEGHQIREELPLLFKLNRAGADAPALPRLLLGGNDTWGFRDLFRGETDTIPLESEELMDWVVAAFGTVLKNGWFPLRLGCDTHVPASLQIAARTLLCQRHAASVRQLSEILAGRCPVVWISLRTRSRVWAGQAMGLAKLMTTVAVRHPRAAFLLDGLPEDQHVATDLLLRLPDSLSVENLLGRPMDEAFALFTLAHAFVMNKSNANALAMLDPKPGVLHGVQGWVGEEPGDLMPSNRPARVVPVSGLRVLTGNATYDQDDTSCNYDLNHNELTAAVMTMLEDLPIPAGQ